MRKRIGIDDLGTELCKGVGDNRLSAADTAGEADNQGHGVQPGR
jgi:hypothetical protein